MRSGHIISKKGYCVIHNSLFLYFIGAEVLEADSAFFPFYEAPRY